MTLVLRTRRSRDSAFTLLELMIVVVIVGILATIASVGYRRYVGRARASEASGMLAEMMSKELTYFTEFAMYYPLRADTSFSSPYDEPAAALYPWNPATEEWDSAREARNIDPAGFPAGWTQLSVRPRAKALYCTYMANAGGTSEAPAAGTFGARIFGTSTSQVVPWFYVLGACNMNNNNPGGLDYFPTEYTIYMLSSDAPKLNVYNENK